MSESFVLSEYTNFLNISSQNYSLLDYSTDIHSNFTIYLLSFGKLILEGSSVINGARIGICAGDIEILSQSIINATGLGCPPGLGFGTTPFETNTSCGIPGASYGAIGGDGG